MAIEVQKIAIYAYKVVELWVIVCSNAKNRLTLYSTLIKIVCMKHILYLSLTLLLVLTSCGKKKADIIDADAQRAQLVKQENEQKREIIRFNPTQYTDSIKGSAHRYAYTIQRNPADSAQLIVDSEGYRAYDNTITLTVKRDGAQIFSRRFSRAAFKIGIGDEEFSHYVLMNMVYGRMTDNGPQFIVSLGEASNDDMFIQYALTVASDGSTNIVRHEIFEEDEISRVDDGV